MMKFCLLILLSLCDATFAEAQPKPIREYFQYDHGAGMEDERLGWEYFYDDAGNLIRIDDHSNSQAEYRFYEFRDPAILPWLAIPTAEYYETDVYLDPNGPPIEHRVRRKQITDTVRTSESQQRSDGVWQTKTTDTTIRSRDSVMLYRRRFAKPVMRERWEPHYDAEGQIDSMTYFFQLSDGFTEARTIWQFYRHLDGTLDSVIVTESDANVTYYTGLQESSPAINTRAMHDKLRIIPDHLRKYRIANYRNGTFIYADTVSRDYDHKGRLISEDRPTLRRRYEYFEEDNMLRRFEESSLQNDGTWLTEVKQAEFRTYGSDGRLLTRMDSLDNPWFKRRFEYAEDASVAGKDAKVSAIYPNPVSQNISISSSPPCEWVLRDLLGRAIDHGAIDQHSRTINVSHLQAGSYLLMLQGSNGSAEQHRIIVAH